MVIDIKKILKNSLTTNDILINEISTYPKNIINQIMSEGYSEDIFKNYFYENTNFNVIGVHFTRLFNYEIDDIKANGLHSDGSADYNLKIQRLPSEFDNYKPKLIAHIENPLNKRSDGYVYFDVGRIELYYGNSVFLKHWGGETLYTYYDKLVNTDKELIQLGNRLRKLTIPCIVIVKVNAYKFFVEFKDEEDLVEYIQENQLSGYKNELWIDKDEVEVFDIIPVKKLKLYY